MFVLGGPIPDVTPFSRRRAALILLAAVVVATCAPVLPVLPGVPAARAATVEPIGASRLDPRLRSFLRRVQGARQDGLSPRAISALTPTLFAPPRLTGDGQDLTVNCLVVLDRADDAGTIERLRALGIETRTQAGSVVTAAIPVDALERLEALPGVQFVEMARTLKPSLDASRASTHADQAWGASAPPFPESGFTGKGMVIGIIDTGIDFSSADFKDATGASRIEKLWDQTGASLPHPSGYSYGTEWTAADINDQVCTETDVSGHGTHVAGIAAGNGAATNGTIAANTYVGVAPEATIIFVKTTFQTTDVVDACRYIFDQAAGRPAVINMSLGTQGGSHDTTDPFNMALDNLTGSGKNMVAAAGNENALGLHARLSLTTEQPDSMVFTFSLPAYTPSAGSDNDYVALDGWYSKSDHFSFVVESPTGKRTPLIAVGNQYESCLPTPGGDGRILVDNDFRPVSGADRNIYVEVTDGSVGQPSVSCNAPKVGTWKIVARKAGPIQNGAVDFWLFADQLGNGSVSPQMVLGKDEARLIAAPASAASVVAVGATITKISWLAVQGNIGYVSVTAADLGKTAPFSSPGPLRDGTLQPDIVAPGMGIAATRSSNTSGNNQLDLRDGKHTINQGTSQASPHVAGAIALIQQKYGPQTPAQIINRLHALSTRDAITGTDPNNSYGYGRLNLFALLELGTPIFLSHLEALPQDDGAVRLSWQVEADEPFLGFHVARSEAADGAYTRMTTTLIKGERDFEYVDRAVVGGRTYWYRLEAVKPNGQLDTFGPLEVRAGAPRLVLAQNGPNPFAARTTIRFGLPLAGPVALRVFDLNGALVRTLLDGPAEAGPGEVAWDGRDAGGAPVPTGVYFYRLTTPHGSETRKMIVQR